MKTKHTPTPWEHDEPVANVIAIDDNCDATIIARCSTPHVSSDEGSCNAAFIVQACNSHDELLTMLERVAVILDDPESSDDPLSIEVLRNDIAGVLAKAKGVES